MRNDPATRALYFLSLWLTFHSISAFQKADMLNFDEIWLVNLLFHDHKGIHLRKVGTFLAAQWSRIHPSNSGGEGSTPGQGIKISHSAW